MDRPRFTLVVPAFNEEAYLPALLDSVDVARRTFAGGPEAIEVVVADNGSTDATARLARQRGCRVAPVEKRVIAAARNGGAAVARGEALCFVDADSRIHPQTFDAIDSALASPRVIAGASGVTLERWSLGLAATYALMLPMLLLLRMDTGVVFVRREDFEAIGGYNEGRKFAEDVQFLWELRRLGRTRGQTLARLRGAKAIASTRKFDTHGDWHYFRRLPWWGVQLLRGKGEAVDEFAERYWYRDR